METKKKRFRLQATRVTPYVEYVPDDSILKIEGRSSPASALEFYLPIIRTLKKYKPANKQFRAEFKMEYFNTSSSKCIYDIFKELILLEQEGYQVMVVWQYQEEDDDMLETGEDFESASGLKFNYNSYAGDN